MRLVCSAISARGRNPSLPASAVQIASNPASSAALAAAGTSRKLRVERPVSSFMSESPLASENQAEGDGNKASARLKREVALTPPATVFEAGSLLLFERRPGTGDRERARREVRDEAVDAAFKEPIHFTLFVHRPYV